jgi:hypothetical protein
MRILVEEEGASFWTANLYDLWLSSLRALSPSRSELADPAAAGLPAVAATEAWGRRLLSAQLASWAELRHDTVLYAKQSYTTSVTCAFPDAYVEPNPAFFSAVGRLAARGRSLVRAVDPTGASFARIDAYFSNLVDVTWHLQSMAEHQRTGAPHDPADVEFINQAVRIAYVGCANPTVSGWYGALFYRDIDDRPDLEFDPTIADVHTDPNESRVLHVGTGSPRLLVVTVDACDRPHAYAGLASSYFETITDNLDRLDDTRWYTMIRGANPADVPWMADLIVR